LDLNFRGTDAIAKYRPGNPLGQLFQFVGELHELPRIPLFLRNRAKHFRDIGSEYLNVEFGWKPFVNDLIKLYKAQRDIKGVLDKLVKNNGIRIKRRPKHEIDTVSGDVEHSFQSHPFFGSLDGLFTPSVCNDLYLLGPTNTGSDYNIEGATSLTVTPSVVTENWFVGTFVYYVPDIGSDRWTQRCKDVMFGGNPTPASLYELYPWSWLVDWFSNVGKILSNLQSNAVDNEAFIDCHVMQTITDRLDVTAHVSWDPYEESIDIPPVQQVLVIPPGSDVLTYSFIKKEKMRQKASPFGFGLNYADFTLRQKSILAALLFSKKRPTLRSLGLS
jgi:hypothetical protein